MTKILRSYLPGVLVLFVLSFMGCEAGLSQKTSDDDSEEFSFSQIYANIAFLKEEVAKLQASMTNSDATLDGKIAALQASMTNSDTALDEKITVLQSSMTNSDTVLDDKISALQASMTNSDTTLDDKISALQASMTNSDTVLDDKISALQASTTNSITSLQSNISNLEKLVLPTGSITPFAGSMDNVPEGWLICDGESVSRSDYIALFNVIGTSWGNGNGATTFSLPDLRGRFLRGVDGDAGNDQDKNARFSLYNGNTGNLVGSYQGDAIRNITGQIGGDSNEAKRDSTEGAFSSTDGGLGNSGDGNGCLHYFDASRVVPTGADNRPKNAAVYYIIKAQ
ncbi:MAG: hypothetical protein GY754_26380 [bacterium]|nr:hypothetical protein [bacterium]